MVPVLDDHPSSLFTTQGFKHKVQTRRGTNLGRGLLSVELGWSDFYFWPAKAVPGWWMELVCKRHLSNPSTICSQAPESGLWPANANSFLGLV